MLVLYFYSVEYLKSSYIFSLPECRHPCWSFDTPDESAASGFPCVAASTTFKLILIGVKDRFRPASLTLHLQTFHYFLYAITGKNCVFAVNILHSLRYRLVTAKGATRLERPG